MCIHTPIYIIQSLQSKTNQVIFSGEEFEDDENIVSGIKLSSASDWV